METLQWLFDGIRPFIPTVVSLVLVTVILFAVRAIMEKRLAGTQDHRFRQQLVMLILSFASLLIVIMVLPINDTSRGQLLSLIGILLSAAIALSSTTFVGNAMAGLMIRTVRGFRPGDFIRVNDVFGRVSERGLFHVEIQTEDRDLTTLPNLYLVTNPVKVIRSSGTLITAEVSLGYDVSRTDIEPLLVKAAEAAGLQDPFVHVIELGDFSVLYRVAGLLPEVKQVLSARSRLREQVLDSLHRGKIEIVSPTFMNQRPIGDHAPFIPKVPHPKTAAKLAESAPAPEAIVFDKADEAESLEKMRERLQALADEIERIKGTARDATDELQKTTLQQQIEQLEKRRERLKEYIKEKDVD